MWVNFNATAGDQVLLEKLQGASGPGGQKGIGRVLEDEDGGDDSDRPAWAGQPGGEGRPGGGGNPNPGATKGDEYGDLIVLARDPVTGLPIVDENGQYLVCLDVACTSTVPTVDGEVPAGVTPVEVDFGRAAVARSPDRVADKALDDALAKVDTGEAQCVFIMNPTRMSEVRACSEKGAKMPQKSTDFYPKVITGLVAMAVGVKEKI